MIRFRFILLLSLLAAGLPGTGAAQHPPSDLPSGRPDSTGDPAQLPDLPSGKPFTPETPDPAVPEHERLLRPDPGKEETAAPKPFTVRQITADGLSHTPCWVEGDRLLYIRSEPDYDPAGTDSAFWQKVETADTGPGSPVVHPLFYARGQVVLREPGGTSRVLTRFEGKHLRTLRCPPSGPFAAFLLGEPGENPSVLAILRWDADPAPDPVLIDAEGIEDFSWSDTGGRLYFLKQGWPWYLNPVTAAINPVTSSPALRKNDFIALWGGPRELDLVLATLQRDKTGKPAGNSLLFLNTQTLNTVRLPAAKPGLGSRFEQWLPPRTILLSSTDFVRFRLFRHDLSTGQRTELRPLPGDADGHWRWSGGRGFWARWNGSAFDELTLLGKDTEAGEVILRANIRYALWSPSGTRIAVDTGSGGTPLNGIDIRRDITVVEFADGKSPAPKPPAGKPSAP